MATEAVLWQPDQVATLARINLDDMLDNFGLSQLRHGRSLVERLFWLPAYHLARQLAEFDQGVGLAGLQAASTELLTHFIHRVDVIGAENIPASGGVIFAANHPGMTDTLACFSALPRADLHVMSTDRPFLRALPNISALTFYVSDLPDERLIVVRQVTRFLQKGGAILIFPAGEIEPDPAVMLGALESLASWSESLGVFVRLAPKVVVVPTVVSGVVHAGSLHNPLTRLRRSRKDRERVAATLQAFWLSVGVLQRRMNVRIEFGTPLPAADLMSSGSSAAITTTITTAIHDLIRRSLSLKEGR